MIYSVVVLGNTMAGGNVLQGILLMGDPNVIAMPPFLDIVVLAVAPFLDPIV